MVYIDLMDIKELLKQWIARDGELTVEKQLLEKGITVSTRMGLIKGRHRGEPRGLLRFALIDLLEKAGFISNQAS